MESVRKKLEIIGHTIEQYDDLQERIAKARWQYEILKRKPELGVRVLPNGQATQITADEIRESIRRMEEEAEVAQEVAAYLSGAADMDAARVRYAELLAAYNRWGQLREAILLYRVGFPLHKLDDGNHATEEALHEAFAKAEAKLRELDESFEIPSISGLTIVRNSLV